MNDRSRGRDSVQDRYDMNDRGRGRSSVTSYDRYRDHDRELDRNRDRGRDSDSDSDRDRGRREVKKPSRHEAKKRSRSRQERSKWLKEWSAADVQAWLQTTDQNHFMSYFRKSNFDGTALLLLDMNSLKTVNGVQSVHIMKLKLLLQRLR